MKTRLIQVQSNIVLQQRLEQIYDHLYANASVKTPKSIAIEVGKLLHTAMYIEQNRPRLFNTSESEQPAFHFTQSDIKKIAQGHITLCHTTSDFVRRQFQKMNEDWKFYPSQTINLANTDIAYVCALLNGIYCSDREKDVFGDALEIFRSRWSKRSGGQFFTDQRAVSLALHLLEFDPRQGDDLIDLCAGTGGFLLGGLNRIRQLMNQDGELSETKLRALAIQSLKGQEVDSDVGEIANATLKARIGDTSHTFVTLADSLKPDMFCDPQYSISYDKHLCVATNPPFGTKTTIKQEDILKNFDLARSTGKTGKRSPDVLFIEQNIKLLKPGLGRMAIVVPYQILSGPQTYFVREWLLRHTHILAIVDLPADTFQPHTGTKASLLVVKRRLIPLENISAVETTDIFMSVPQWIGHDRRGKPVYKFTVDHQMTDEILSDFDDVEQAFTAFKSNHPPQKVHKTSFVVSTKQILSDSQLRLNALYYQPSSLVVSSHQKDLWRVVKLKELVSRIFYPTRFKRHYVKAYEGQFLFWGGQTFRNY